MTLDVGGGKAFHQSFQSLSRSEQKALEDGAGKETLQKILFLSREKDRGLFWQKALHLAQRLVAKKDLNSGMALLGRLSQARDSVPPAIQKKANQEFKAILGRGRIFKRWEFLSERVFQAATDYKLILPMFLGSFAYPLARTGTFGKLVFSKAPWTQRRFTANILSVGAGFTSEVLTFTLSSRALRSFAGEQFGPLGQELIGAVTSLGALRLFGQVGHQAMARLAAFPRLSKIGRPLIYPSTTFLGLLGAHGLESLLGLRTPGNSTNLVVDTLASLVSLSLGAHLGHRGIKILFPNISQIQRGLSHQALWYEKILRGFSSNEGEAGGQSFGPAGGNSMGLALAGGTVHQGRRVETRDRVKFYPPHFLSEKNFDERENVDPKKKFQKSEKTSGFWKQEFKNPFLSEMAELISHLKPLEEGGEPPAKLVDKYRVYYQLPQSPIPHRMWTFSSEGVQLVGQSFFPLLQAKKTVILLHGYYDHVGTQSHLIKALVEAGHPVVSFDLPGHGLSDGARADIGSMKEYTRALEAFLASMKGTHFFSEDPHFLGHSTGGAIGLEAMAKGPLGQVDKVVLLAPLLRWSQWGLSGVGMEIFSHMISSLPRRFPKSTSNPDFELFRKTMDHLQHRRQPLSWARAMRQWSREFEAGGRIGQPMLIIQGTRDKTLDWRYNLAAWSRKLPKAKLVQIRGAGHNLPNERQDIREGIFKQVLDYLSKG